MPLTSGTGRPRGFTLIELMVVMTILVMVAALFPVALDRAMPGRRVDGTAEGLVSMVREAQSVSVATGRSISLRIQDHALVTRDATSAVHRERTLQFPSATEVTLADLEGRAVPALVVYPDGSAQGGRFDVEDHGHGKTVLVSPVTGRVSIASLP